MSNTDIAKQLMGSSEETKKLFSMLGNIDNCDDKCEAKKSKLDKEIKFLAIAEQKKNIDDEYKLAEKNYIISDKGEAYYNDYIRDKLEKKERDRLDDIETIFNDQIKVYENIKTVVKNQNSFQSNFNAMKDIYKEAKRRNDDIDNMLKKTEINDRYSYYVNNDMNSLSNMQHVLKIIYWSFFSIIIVMVLLK